MIIKSHRYWKLFEMLPGAITILLLIFPVVFSIMRPTWVAVFITLYATMWLFRSIRLSIYLTLSYIRSRNAFDTDWMKLILYCDTPQKLEYDLAAMEKRKNKDEKKCRQMLNLREKLGIIQRAYQYKKSSEIIHAIIYVTYKEPYEVVRESIKSYAASIYPSKKIIIVFSGEEKDQENAQAIAEKIKNEFGDKFMDFVVTIHPYGLPNEIPGKSANATWAAKLLKKYLDKKNIAYSNVIISNFDADTVAHKNYFAEITYLYLTTLNREIKTYQPPHFYHNNIWNVPMAIRITALGCTFWEMAESNDIKVYRSFSSRSMSMQLAINTDYWDPMVMPEDSRQYWTAYFLENGHHELIIVKSPLYMDAVSAGTYKETFKAQYKQIRRWAYGVCDLPFIVFNMAANKKIPIFEKIYQTLFMIERNVMWATAPIILTFSGWLPGLLNPPFRETVMSYNLPSIVSILLTVASVGVITCAIITLIVIPRPKNKITWHYISLIIQWFLIPLSSIFLSAIPAIEAQGRLLIGKKLEYQVAPKIRKENV